MNTIIERDAQIQSISQVIESEFPKAKREYLKTYNNWEGDCHILFEFMSCNLGINVPSDAVDEIWHGCILYTQKYAAFCMKHFGRFVHHVPGDSDCHCQDSACSACCGN